MKLLIAISAFLALTACATTSNDIETPLDDGYQFLDGVGTVITLQARYCATADPTRRAALLGTIRALGMAVPPSGACTDILSLVDPVTLIDMDVEKAEEDRKRFQNED